MEARCSGCYLRIDPKKGQKVLKALNKEWHPECFTCHGCKKELSGTFTVHRDVLAYCERCYDYMCAGCEKIIDSSYLTLGKKKYHEKCIKCTVCRIQLDIKNILLIDNVPYCEFDYKENRKPAVLCPGCDKEIKDATFVKALDKKWHNECFVCTFCKKPFPDKEFNVLNGKPYCDRHKDQICAKCKDFIEPGTQFVTFNGKKRHKKCFRCNLCADVLDISGFYTHEDLPYCDPCYDKVTKTK